MDRRPYYLQKAHEVASLADHAGDALSRQTLLAAARAWMMLFELEDPVSDDFIRRRHDPAQPVAP